MHPRQGAARNPTRARGRRTTAGSCWGAGGEDPGNELPLESKWIWPFNVSGVPAAAPDPQARTSKKVTAALAVYSEEPQ